MLSFTSQHSKLGDLGAMTEKKVIRHQKQAIIKRRPLSSAVSQKKLFMFPESKNHTFKSKI